MQPQALTVAALLAFALLPPPARKTCFTIVILPDNESALEQTIQRRMSLQLANLGLLCPNYEVSSTTARLDSSAIMEFFNQARHNGIDEISMVHLDAHVWEWDEQGGLFDAVTVAWDQVYRVTPEGRRFIRVGGAYVIHWGRNYTSGRTGEFASQSVDKLLNFYAVQ